MHVCVCFVCVCARVCVCVLQMHSDHIMNLSGKLGAPSSGKDLLLNLMKDLESFLPKGIKSQKCS